MKITILAIGSRGDLQPAIALGKALQQRGHSIVIFAGVNFHSWIKQHGLIAAPTKLNMQALMNSHGGQEWVRQGHKPLVQMRLMKQLINKYGWQIMWDAWQACQGSDAIISSFTSDVYAVSLAEKLNVPHISMALQPSLMATRSGGAIMNAPRPHKESLINYWFSKLFLERVPWQLYGALNNQLRKALGLSKQSARQNKAARQQTLILHAYSPEIVPQPTEWPPNVHTTGYWFLEDNTDWQAPPELLEFLNNGFPPVYIGFGSMSDHDPVALTQIAIGALQLSGQRGIIQSGWTELSSAQLPPNIFTLQAAPHHWLFPRMAAIVHHGGAGTTATGLHAGVPSVIIPYFTDQPFWGDRIYRLGLGTKPIKRYKLTEENLAQAITNAVTSAYIQEQLDEISPQLRAEMGLAKAVALIEQKLGIAALKNYKLPNQSSPKISFRASSRAFTSASSSSSSALSKP